MNIPEPWVLAADRTQWDVGNSPVNILTLGVVHEGIAFPLVWMMLDKKGNSNTQERIDLMERFYELFPHTQVRCLTSDREFVGSDWLSYLLLSPDAKLKTPFRMRIRDSEMLWDGHRQRKARTLFAHLQPGETRCYRNDDGCGDAGCTLQQLECMMANCSSLRLTKRLKQRLQTTP